MPLGIALGNTKLGLDIASFNLPAVKTCPGRSNLCEKLCYAQAGRFHFNSVKTRLQRNWKELAESDAMIPVLCHQIKTSGARVVRIHASGDFYNEAYVLRWLEIVRRNRRVKFYAYTRSWRLKDARKQVRMRRILGQLAREPNFTLFLSWDRETGAPPKLKGTFDAFMMTDDNDHPTSPATLVFRDKQRTTMKRTADGSLVCPYDQHSGAELTCSRCGLCFDRSRLNKVLRR